MRKFLHPLALALTLAGLTAGALALSSDDSLVSLRYLTDTFFPQAVQAGELEADRALENTFTAAKDELDAARRGLAGQEEGDAGLYSETLQRRDWSEGQIIGLPAGSGLLMLRGGATVTHGGAFVDVTDGTEVPSGGSLTPGHRYLVGEGTTAGVTVQSGRADMGVQGSYTLAGGQEKNPLPFYDVSRNDWFYAPVDYAYENGLFSGLEEGVFGPSAPMTRAMLMTVFYQLAGAPAQEMAGASAVLSDVPDGAWFAPYVRWAVSQNIASGTGAGTFSPNAQVTREQLVVLLYSFAANYQGKAMAPGADLSGYTDLNQSSTWAREALSWAVGQGILGSSSAGGLTLSPQRSATRAEVAAMLRVFSEKM